MNAEGRIDGIFYAAASRPARSKRPHLSRSMHSWTPTSVGAPCHRANAAAIFAKRSWKIAVHELWRGDSESALPYGLFPSKAALQAYHDGPL